MITQQYLKECLYYDSDTGVFTWLSRPLCHFKDARAMKITNTSHDGNRAGTVFTPPNSRASYISIGINGHPYRAHRLAFLYVYGSLPEAGIDHKNGIGTDNRIENIREASTMENHRNMPIPSDNKSGVMGVGFHKKRWRAFISVKRRQIHLGNFINFDDAVSARKKAEIDLGFHPNHGRD